MYKVTYSVRAQNILKYYLAIYGESVSYSKLCCCLVAKCCPTFCDCMDCSLSDSLCQWNFRAEESMNWICHSFLGIFPAGIKTSSPALQEDSLPMSHQQNPASKLSCWFSSHTMNLDHVIVTNEYKSSSTICAQK